MKKSILLLVLASTLGLVACDRSPTVVNVPTPVAVPGPAGPQGAVGNTGATGKAGEGTTVIVMPAASSAQ